MSNVILECQHLCAEAKRQFLRDHAEKQVVMDFSTIDPLPFYQEFPNLLGSFPGQFAIDGKCELHLREGSPAAIEALKDYGLHAVLTSQAGLGFTVPRTLAMIINEAYFALDEKVASSADIDRAMRFGVNYPQGPFALAKGREALYVELLENLAKAYPTGRYRVAPSLKAAT